MLSSRVHEFMSSNPAEVKEIFKDVKVLSASFLGRNLSIGTQV
jgi:hypothetical protein